MSLKSPVTLMNTTNREVLFVETSAATITLQKDVDWVGEVERFNVYNPNAQDITITINDIDVRTIFAGGGMGAVFYKEEILKFQVSGITGKIQIQLTR